LCKIINGRRILCVGKKWFTCFWALVDKWVNGIVMDCSISGGLWQMRQIAEACILQICKGDLGRWCILQYSTRPLESEQRYSMRSLCSPLIHVYRSSKLNKKLLEHRRSILATWNCASSTEKTGSRSKKLNARSKKLNARSWSDYGYSLRPKFIKFSFSASVAFCNGLATDSSVVLLSSLIGLVWIWLGKSAYL